MNTREVYIVKQTSDGSYLLHKNSGKFNPWEKNEVPIELVRFFPDITSAKQAGSNQADAVEEGDTYKRKYKIIKVNLSMEEIEEVFEQ